MASGEPRRCPHCKETKPRSEFPGVHGYCRPCHAEYTRTQYRRKSERVSDYARKLNLRRYGLTLEQFAAMLAAQDGRCAICQTTEPDGQGWHIDHDHTCCNTRKRSCGKCLRGLLCSRCNIALGNFRDDPVIIKAALEYIQAYRFRRDAMPTG